MQWIEAENARWENWMQSEQHQGSASHFWSITLALTTLTPSLADTLYTPLSAVPAHWCEVDVRIHADDFSG